MPDTKMEWSIFALVELRIALTDSEGFSVKIPLRNSALLHKDKRMQRIMHSPQQSSVTLAVLGRLKPQLWLGWH